MKKIVKGKIEKHYCDCCGRSIYDFIPRPTTRKLFGAFVLEMHFKKNYEFKRYGSGRNEKEYCMDCYEDVTAKINAE